MIGNLVYLYLLSPLHTGGTTQEGNLLGIARESHTDLPYIPSSSIRGRLRASVEGQELKYFLFGNEINAGDKLEQGTIWIGDGSILWLPVPSLSHGVVWVSCPMLLQRWARLNQMKSPIPKVSDKCSVHPDLAKGKPIYLKDAILKPEKLEAWDTWNIFVPQSSHASGIRRVIVLPDQQCSTLIQMSLWRQVKVKLDEHKTVDGGFRYEEAIPPDTLMYFPWGVTSQVNGKAKGANLNPESEFKQLLKQDNHALLQIGGQESLGRGFVQVWMNVDESVGGRNDDF
ncbi:type III-B CRISPR module RAMP protein Cmr4 [Thermoleptolyngbya sp.]